MPILNYNCKLEEICHSKLEMNTPELTIIFFSVILLMPTLASLTRFDQWWIRGFDFPRLQICFLILLTISFSLFFYDFHSSWHYILNGLLILSFLYQAAKIYPYTVLAKKQVQKYKGSEPESRFSILVSNVLTTNKQYDKLIDHVNQRQPDLLLTLESDKRWEKALTAIEKYYPFKVKVPQDNLYGMHLYSKLELLDIEVKYLISREIPSIHGYVKLANGKKIKIHCLHPKPPSPSEDDTSTNRDAELLLVGRELNEAMEPTLVFGDLNDVAWSRTTKLFQKISGLLDPRVGRGFFNTYHAGYPFFRWPLDHIFHSSDFSLVQLRRLKSIGSDHFPIFIKLNYEPKKEDLHDRPETPDEEEEDRAEEKIEKGQDGE